MNKLKLIPIIFLLALFVPVVSFADTKNEWVPEEGEIGDLYSNIHLQRIGQLPIKAVIPKSLFFGTQVLGNDFLSRKEEPTLETKDDGQNNGEKTIDSAGAGELENQASIVKKAANFLKTFLR